MNRVLSLSLVTLFLFLFAFAAYGYPGKRHGWHGKSQWWDRTEVLEQLNLTDQQKGEIDEITSSGKERMENLHTRLETEYGEFKEEMKDPNATRDEILSEYNQLEGTYTELKRAKIEMILDIREVLLPEQRTKLVDIKEQHGDHHRKDK